MKEYFLRNRKGQFVAIGIIFMLLGFLCLKFNASLATFLFYVSMFFLAFMQQRMRSRRQ